VFYSEDFVYNLKMKTINYEDIAMHKLFKQRKSVRSFTDETVTDEQLKKILNAGMVAPSGMGAKKYEFVVVRDKEMLNELSEVGRWIGFIAESSVAIVVISQEHDYWIEDGALVTGFMSLEAVNQGLGSCWADIRNGPNLDGTEREVKVRKLLDVPEKYRVLCVLPIGVPSKEVKEHGDKSFDKKKVHYGKF